MYFYNDRRPRPEKDGDADTPMSKYAVADANRRILDAVPDHRREVINTRIRTTAVQRHRRRQRGEGDFDSIAEYTQFIYGTDE
jgi:hypothetical protein